MGVGLWEQSFTKKLFSLRRLIRVFTCFPAQDLFTQSSSTARGSSAAASDSHSDQFLLGFMVCDWQVQLGRVLLRKSVQVDGNTHQEGSGGKRDCCIKGKDQQIKTSPR